MKEGPVREIKQGLRFIHEASSALESGDPEFLEFRARAVHLMEVTDEALKPRDADWLNWYERRRKTVIFHASPLDVSEGMRAHLFDRLETAVFTSATLSINGDFSYFRKRVGVPDNGLEAVHPSHFDFKAQTLMYLPKDLPLPPMSVLCWRQASEYGRSSSGPRQGVGPIHQLPQPQWGLSGP